MIVLAKGSVPEIPRSLFICPICGAQIVAEIDCWEQNADRTWQAAECKLNCSTEPDIDGKEWWDWHHNHFRVPYVDWLPLEIRVLAWMQANFRFAEGVA